MKWKMPPLFSNYEVSEFGHVRKALSFKKTSHREHAAGTPMSIFIMKGYPACRLVDDNGIARTILISQLVALAHIGPRPTLKHGALHRDDNPKNNHYTNLYWGKQKQNSQDAVRNGKIPVGGNGWNAKLSDKEASEIKRIYKPYKCGLTRADLAQRYAVSKRTISRVLDGETFNWPLLPTEGDE